MPMLKNIVYFEAIYKNNNFRKSADELGVSIATLSRTLKELELDFGHVLFIKDGVKIQPTSAAHRLYEKISGVSCELSNIYYQSKFREQHLSILIPPQVSSTNLIDLVYQYNEQHNTSLIVNEINHYESRETALDSLTQGSLDLIIDTEEPSGARYKTSLLKSIELVFVASAKYYQEINKDIVLNNNLPFVRVSWLGIYGEQINRHLGVGENENIGYHTENIKSFLEAVESTEFIGLFPKEKVEHLSQGFVVSEEVVTSVDLYLIASKGTLASREVISWFFKELSEKEELMIY